MIIFPLINYVFENFPGNSLSKKTSQKSSLAQKIECYQIPNVRVVIIIQPGYNEEKLIYQSLPGLRSGWRTMRRIE
jgi:hypothetical protein